MVYPLIIRTVGTYLLKKSAKKQLKKDLAQTQRTSEKKLKNTENLGNVDRFTKVGKNKTFTDADKAFYSGANKTKEDKTINKMLQEYTKRHRANK